MGKRILKNISKLPNKLGTWWRWFLMGRNNHWAKQCQMFIGNGVCVFEYMLVWCVHVYVCGVWVCAVCVCHLLESGWGRTEKGSPIILEPMLLWPIMDNIIDLPLDKICQYLLGYLKWIVIWKISLFVLINVYCTGLFSFSSYLPFPWGQTHVIYNFIQYPKPNDSTPQGPTVELPHELNKNAHIKTRQTQKPFTDLQNAPSRVLKGPACACGFCSVQI